MASGRAIWIAILSWRQNERLLRSCRFLAALTPSTAVAVDRMNSTNKVATKTEQPPVRALSQNGFGVLVLLVSTQVNGAKRVCPRITTMQPSTENESNGPVPEHWPLLLGPRRQTVRTVCHRGPNNGHCQNAANNDHSRASANLLPQACRLSEFLRNDVLCLITRILRPYIGQFTFPSVLPSIASSMASTVSFFRVPWPYIGRVLFQNGLPSRSNDGVLSPIGRVTGT